MNVSAADIDWIIRRSIEGPDNPVGAVIVFFVVVYAVAGLILLCAGIVGLLGNKEK